MVEHMVGLWFIWGCFLVALIIFIKWREKTLRSEKALLEKKVETRTHELQEEKEKAENTWKKVKELQAQLVEKEKINERFVSAVNCMMILEVH
jgi:predicted Holliday junction resolvase-like endonuclease